MAAQKTSAQSHPPASPICYAHSEEVRPEYLPEAAKKDDLKKKKSRQKNQKSNQH